MDILLRNVDPVAVKKIDELAKEKGISRQEFLRGQIEMMAFFREQTTRELDLENLIDKNIQMMGKCVHFMEWNAKSLEKLHESIENVVGEIEEL
ncbi:hypothetical protein BEH_24955 (plasmid) [Priestia filamentosa]|uniref:Ribbon-helix-helix protein CopG domain-containing protein n=1 Tax=Priestia filamentosa TaxID=1402861 RepID=A0A2S1LZJ8_9BACI|nr:hypothetical protein [Priestia filamentosa]AWG44243.1 hypothetical protein BEH_24955 [Priestia filamentosa]